MYTFIEKAKSYLNGIFHKDTDYIGIDKIKHFSICYVIALLDTKIAIGVALGKEGGDYFNSKSHWCWWDLLADGLGIILGTLTRMWLFS